MLEAADRHNRPPDRPLRTLPLEEIPIPEAERLRWAELGAQSIRRLRLGECMVLLAIEAGKWHLSISHPDRLPTWAELVEARYRLMPDSICAAMLLPSKDDYVNVHPTCLHLWEVTDPSDLEG